MQGTFGRITTIALVAIALAASTAQAQNQTDKAKAQALVEKATELYSQQKYEQALELYEQAYGYYASPVIVMNIGSTLLNLGRKADAANAYQAVLRDEQRDKAQDPVIRDILTKQLAPSLARIRVSVPAEDAESVRINVDGKAVAAPADSDIWVDPGSRSVTVTWPDGSARPLTVQAKAGQLHELEATRPAADTQGSPGETMPLMSTAPVDSAERPGGGYRIGFWVSAAVTAAAFGGGLVATMQVGGFEDDKLEAIKEWNEANADMALAEGDACSDAEMKGVQEVIDICEKGQSQATLANTLYVAGWVGTAATVFLLYKGYIAPPAAGEPATALITPTVTPTTVGAQLTWSF